MLSSNYVPQPCDPAERVVAWRHAALLLVALTVVKYLGGIPYLGTVAFTLVAFMQLLVPLRRAEKLGKPDAYVGLHLGAWRTDLKYLLLLVGLTFPPYIVGHHFYMTELAGWLSGLGFEDAARMLPQRQLALFGPLHGSEGFSAFLGSAAWFAEIVAIHTLGVALPEETFYRGYLQPHLETLWVPKRRIFGVKIGKAAVVAAVLFALGHFLGEWNPLRLGPFFPGLLFAWLRNASGSVVGAISYHAACNVLGEILSTQYQPI